MNDAGTTRLQSAHGTGGAAGAESSWPKWLKITGIGCAALLLVGGLLVGLGVFRVAACCSEFGDLAETAEQVQIEGHEFALELHEGDFEGAYQRLDESVRDEVDVETFEASFDEYRSELAASRPFPMRLDIDEQDFDVTQVGDLDRWYLTTQFAEPRYDELLELQFVVETRRIGEEETAVNVLDWEFQRRAEEFSRSRYAETARRFQDRLMRGDLEQAHRMVSPEVEFAAQGVEAFSEEVRPLSQRLSEFERVEVYGLYPHDGVESIVVRMLLVDEAGETHAVDYVVNWRSNIQAVSEIEALDVDLAAIDGIEDAADEDEDDEPEDDDDTEDEDDVDADGVDDETERE